LTAGRRAGGFTIMELLMSILIIFLLMGLLIAGVHHVMRRARGTADRAAVSSLKTGVSAFTQAMSFLPPLVKDGGLNGTSDPVDTAGQPIVYSVSDPMDAEALRGGPASNDGEPGTYPVFSVYSLPYYLVGALETDGVPGAGFRAVKRNGGFEKAGRIFKPFYDQRQGVAIYEVPPAGHGKIELRDGRNTAFRYYRWLPDAGQPNPQHPAVNTAIGLDYLKIYLNVPRILYDPYFWQPFSTLTEPSPELPAELRSAEYAIVGAGPNGMFGDEPATQIADRLGLPNPTTPEAEQKLRAAAWGDNVVEVGQK
jgi:competence protein ComGC